MNDELQRQLAELLKMLIASAKDAGAFASQQIPPLVQEKIRFGRAWHTIAAALLAIALWRVFLFTQEQYTKASTTPRKSYEVWPERPGGILSIVGAVASFGVSIALLIHLHQAVEAWVAPRLYIVDWLLSLTHSS